MQLYFIFLIMTLFEASKADLSIYVDSNYNSTGTGEISSPYQDLSDAFQSASQAFTQNPDQMIQIFIYPTNDIYEANNSHFSGMNFSSMTITKYFYPNDTDLSPNPNVSISELEASYVSEIIFYDLNLFITHLDFDNVANLTIKNCALVTITAINIKNFESISFLNSETIYVSGNAFSNSNTSIFNVNNVTRYSESDGSMWFMNLHSNTVLYSNFYGHQMKNNMTVTNFNMTNAILYIMYGNAVIYSSMAVSFNNVTLEYNHGLGFSFGPTFKIVGNNVAFDGLYMKNIHSINRDVPLNVIEYILKIETNRLLFRNFEFENNSIIWNGANSIIQVNFRVPTGSDQYNGFYAENILIKDCDIENLTFFTTIALINTFIPIYNLRVLNTKLNYCDLFSVQLATLSLLECKFSHIIINNSYVATLSGQEYAIYINRTEFDHLDVISGYIFSTSSFQPLGNTLRQPKFYSIFIFDLSIKNSELKEGTRFFDIDQSHNILLNNINIINNTFHEYSIMLNNKGVVSNIYLSDQEIQAIYAICSTVEDYSNYYSTQIDPFNFLNSSTNIGYPLICGPMIYIILNKTQEVGMDITNSTILNNTVTGFMINLYGLLDCHIYNNNFTGNKFTYKYGSANGVIVGIGSSKNVTINNNIFSGQSGIGFCIALENVMDCQVFNNKIFDSSDAGFLSDFTVNSNVFNFSSNIFYRMTSAFRLVDLRYSNITYNFTISNNQFIDVSIYTLNDINLQVNLISLSISSGLTNTPSTVYHSGFENNIILGCHSVSVDYSSQSFFNSLFYIDANGYFLDSSRNMFLWNFISGNFKLVVATVFYMKNSDNLVYSNYGKGDMALGQGFFFVSGYTQRFQNCSFISNYVFESGIFSLQATNAGKKIEGLIPTYTIFGCLFYNNTGSGGTILNIKFFDFLLIVANNFFIQNYIGSYQSLFYLRNSHVSIFASENIYQQQVFLGAGAIYSLLNTNITTFASSEDSILDTIATQENTLFVTNYQTKPAVYGNIFKIEKLTLESTQAINFTIFAGLYINLEIRDFSLNNAKLFTTLFDFNPILPAYQNSTAIFDNININDIEFLNNGLSLFSALQSASMSALTNTSIVMIFNNSRFTNIRSPHSGTSPFHNTIMDLYTLSKTNIIINNSEFQNMTCMQGCVGFFSTLYDTTVTISNTTFLNMGAVLTASILLGNITNAIFMNNTFSNCTAQLRGGSIGFLNAYINLTQFVENNTLDDNNIAPSYFIERGYVNYTNSTLFTTQPKVLMVQVLNKEPSNLFDYKIDPATGNIIELSNLITDSLHALSVRCIPYDIYGQYVYDETAISAKTLVYDDYTELFYSSYMYYLDEIYPKLLYITVPNYVITFPFCDLISCYKSKEYFSPITMYSKEIDYFLFSVASQVLKPIALSVPIQFASQCPEGYEMVENSSCHKCKIGSYALDQKCYSCPDHASCPGGTEIELYEGFWSPNQSLPNVSVQCTYPELCSENDQCIEGRTGILCMACDIEAGYFSNGLDCVLCESNSTVYFVNISLFLMAFAYLVLTYYFTWEENKSYLSIYMEAEAFKEDYADKKIERMIRGAYKKLLTMNLVIFAAIFGTFDQTIFRTWFDFVIVPLFRLVFTVETNFNGIDTSPSLTGSPVACLLYQYGYKDPKSLYFATTYFVILSPVASFLLLILLIVFIRRMRNLNYKIGDEVKSVLQPIPVITTSFLSMSTVYLVTVVRASIGFLTCIESYPGYYGSSLNQDVSCSDSDYISNKTTIQIILFFYLGIFLFIVLNYLNYGRKMPRTIRYSLSFAHLFSNFPSNKYYWGGVTMMLTLIILFVSGVMQSDPSGKTVLIISIILIYLNLYNIIQPSKSNKEAKSNMKNRSLSIRSYLAMSHDLDGNQRIQNLEEKLKKHSENINRDENFVMELSLVNTALGFIYPRAVLDSSKAVTVINIVAPLINLYSVSYMVYKIATNWRRLRNYFNRLKNYKTWCQKRDRKSRIDKSIYDPTKISMVSMKYNDVVFE